MSKKEDDVLKSTLDRVFGKEEKSSADLLREIHNEFESMVVEESPLDKLSDYEHLVTPEVIQRLRNVCALMIIRSNPLHQVFSSMMTEERKNDLEQRLLKTALVLPDFQERVNSVIASMIKEVNNADCKIVVK